MYFDPAVSLIELGAYGPTEVIASAVVGIYLGSTAGQRKSRVHLVGMGADDNDIPKGLAYFPQ
jgi:hypothetical protein